MKKTLLSLAITILVVPSYSTAQQINKMNPASLGTTALISPDANAQAPSDFITKRSIQVDGRLGPAINNGNPATALQVPGPASAQAVAASTRGVNGFTGLSHLDQLRAGTGPFANSQFSLEPPDQGLAAGNGFILESVNDALAVYDQTGKLLVGPTPLNQFFNRRPEFNRADRTFGDFVADPKALFDRQTQRWFTTALEIDVDPVGGFFTGGTHLLIAVSQTGDPTGQFNLFSIDTTDDGSNGTVSHPGCPCFGDQPLLGANAHGLFISTNEFGLQQGFNGAQVYALSKRQLARGVAPAVVHLGNLPFPEGIPFSIQPAVSGDDGDDREDGDGPGGVEFFMSTPDITLLFDNRVAVWALANTRSLASATPSVTLTHVVIPSETFGVPNDAAQKTGATFLGNLFGEPEEVLQTNDQRMNQVVFARGRLWSALTTSVKQGPNCVTGFESDCKAGIAWFAVVPRFGEHGLRAEVEKQGYVSVQGNNVFFPSIAVGREGAAIAFSLSGQDFFPSAAFVRLGEDGAGRVHVAAAGAGPEDGFTGYARFGGNGHARWGDYTAAVSDGESIWIASEFIPGGRRSFLANWGTFIARIHAGDRDDDR
ncbi:MAG TPA: hypothetical protein VNW97_23905 [Candidatus Saccharimonadales bacterium]|jgi:hypothetical protein|nr:hypothetical protein [Candidatus Saccharimonadales bacterium]